jgi:threonine/homoserine/homoserine lactone efflux protein
MSVDLSLLLSFMNFAFVASITPGPNNMMVMASGIAFGMRATLPHIAGIALGFGAMLSAMMLGLGTVLERLPILLDALKWGGIAWLLYMAWQLASPALSRSPFGMAQSAVGTRSRPMTLFEAALFQWVNPKAWTMAVAVTAAYANLAGDVWQSALIMLVAFSLVAPLCNGTWLLAGRLLGAVLSSDIWGRLAVLLMAGLIVLSAGLIALS